MRLVLIFLILSGCASHQSIGQKNYIFPSQFKALQIVKIKVEGKSRRWMATLERNKNQYKTIFLDPVLQSPLLELKGRSPASVEVNYFISEKYLPFDAKRILISIMEVYDLRPSNSFKYQLDRLNNFAGCVFPQYIQMESLNKEGAKVFLQIETREIECSP